MILRADLRATPAPTLAPAPAPVPNGASLAWARPGRRYRVTAVLLEPVRERCNEAGLAEGAEVTCTSNGRCAVYLSTHDGRRRRIERAYASFVGVEPL